MCAYSGGALVQQWSAMVCIIFVCVHSGGALVQQWPTMICNIFVCAYSGGTLGQHWFAMIFSCMCVGGGLSVNIVLHCSLCMCIVYVV